MVWNILLDDVLHIIKINTHLNLFISILKFLQKILSNTDFHNKSYYLVILSFYSCISVFKFLQKIFSNTDFDNKLK